MSIGTIILIALVVANCYLALVYTPRAIFPRFWRPGQTRVCWGHRLEEVRDTRLHAYYECRSCGARFVVPGERVRNGQPIDKQWLETGEWFHNRER